MAFNYQKHKENHSGDSFWTSYSDLFLGLSTIFLLLYVVSSLRTSTDGLKSQVENQKLTMKVDEMSNQLKIYENMKNEYLKQEASRDEVKEYEELMDKLTLLQEEAKNDKERLAREALENENKAKALNKYQQMVRNVLNANKVAKTKLINRDELIKNQDDELTDQNQEIAQLQDDITEKKQLIVKGEKQIAKVTEALKDKMSDLKQALKRNQITKQAYEKQMARAKAESEKKLSELKQANRQYTQELNATAQQLNQAKAELAQTAEELENKNQALAKTTDDLNQTNTRLNQTAQQLNQTAQQLNEKENELDRTADQLNKTKGALANTKGLLNKKEMEARALAEGLEKERAEGQAKMAALQGQFNADRARERAAFENELKKHKYGAAERAKKEAEFRAGMEAKERALNGKLAALQGQLKDTEGQLAQAKSEIDARRSIAKEIKKGFDRAGVKADINMGTGEVVIDFGEHYFDSNSANLKSEMKAILEKAMPVYSRSLFGNPNVANKISAVEVIGFASPTYQGRYIDPKSTKPEDLQAIKYNMDLSYKRAKAIFTHVLDESEMQFEHQKELLGLMRVSGRSFLEVMNVNRNVASAAEFCKLNDCKKAQRVIIKFSMDGKK